MKDQQIRSTQKLHVGLIDFGTNFPRSGVDRCVDQFSAVEVIDEASLISALQKRGIQSTQLLSWGSQFAAFQKIPGIELLLLVFKSGEKKYLRSINYLAETVSTVVMDIDRPTCDELLRAQRLSLVESHPPLADVYVDDRKIGEAPVWTYLKDGSYQVKCVLPGQAFNPVTMSIPREIQVMCQRENTSAQNIQSQPDEPSAEEGAGSVLVYIVGAAATAAAIVLPFLIFR